MDCLDELGVSIPWLEKSEGLQYAGPFRANLQSFLKTYGIKIPLYAFGLKKITAYLIKLVHQTPEPGITILHVYEEKLAEEVNAVCDQCRNMGWQHHPVCNRKYHFIIPGNIVLADPHQLPTKVEALLCSQDPSISFAQLTVEAPSGNDSYCAAVSVFESSFHCLHGVLHFNGYGHLIRVTGRDGGVGTLTGRQVVCIWDSLCRLLCVQDVSVEDVANKSGMLLRMLHGVAHKKTWYGKWGYDFGRSTYNWSREQYLASLHAVHHAPIQDIIVDLQGVDEVLMEILRKASQQHQEGEGGVKIVHLGPLLRHMLKTVMKAQAAGSNSQHVPAAPNPALVAIDFPYPGKVSSFAQLLATKYETPALLLQPPAKKSETTAKKDKVHGGSAVFKSVQKHTNRHQQKHTELDYVPHEPSPITGAPASAGGGGGGRQGRQCASLFSKRGSGVTATLFSTPQGRGAKAAQTQHQPIVPSSGVITTRRQAAAAQLQQQQGYQQQYDHEQGHTGYGYGDVDGDQGDLDSEEEALRLASMRRTSRRATRGPRSPPAPVAPDLLGEQLQGAIPVHAAQHEQHGNARMLAMKRTSAARQPAHVRSRGMNADSDGFDDTVLNGELQVHEQHAGHGVQSAPHVREVGDVMLPPSRLGQELKPVTSKQVMSIPGMSYDKAGRMILAILNILQGHGVGCWMQRKDLVAQVSCHPDATKSKGTIADVLNCIAGKQFGSGWAVHRMTDNKSHIYFWLERQRHDACNLLTCSVDELMGAAPGTDSTHLLPDQFTAGMGDMPMANMSNGFNMALPELNLGQFGDMKFPPHPPLDLSMLSSFQGGMHSSPGLGTFQADTAGFPGNSPHVGFGQNLGPPGDQALFSPGMQASNGPMSSLLSGLPWADDGNAAGPPAFPDLPPGGSLLPPILPPAPWPPPFGPQGVTSPLAGQAPSAGAGNGMQGLLTPEQIAALLGGAAPPLQGGTNGAAGPSAAPVQTALPKPLAAPAPPPSSTKPRIALNLGDDDDRPGASKPNTPTVLPRLDLGGPQPMTKPASSQAPTPTTAKAQGVMSLFSSPTNQHQQQQAASAPTTSGNPLSALASFMASSGQGLMGHEHNQHNNAVSNILQALQQASQGGAAQLQGNVTHDKTVGILQALQQASQQQQQQQQGLVNNQHAFNLLQAMRQQASGAQIPTPANGRIDTPMRHEQQQQQQQQTLTGQQMMNVPATLTQVQQQQQQPPMSPPPALVVNDLKDFLAAYKQSQQGSAAAAAAAGGVGGVGGGAAGGPPVQHSGGGGGGGGPQDQSLPTQLMLPPGAFIGFIPINNDTSSSNIITQLPMVQAPTDADVNQARQMPEAAVTDQEVFTGMALPGSTAAHEFAGVISSPCHQDEVLMRTETAVGLHPAGEQVSSKTEPSAAAVQPAAEHINREVQGTGHDATATAHDQYQTGEVDVVGHPSAGPGAVQGSSSAVPCEPMTGPQGPEHVATDVAHHQVVHKAAQASTAPAANSQSDEEGPQKQPHTSQKSRKRALSVADTERDADGHDDDTEGQGKQAQAHAQHGTSDAQQQQQQQEHAEVAEEGVDAVPPPRKRKPPARLQDTTAAEPFEQHVAFKSRASNNSSQAVAAAVDAHAGVGKSPMGHQDPPDQATDCNEVELEGKQGAADGDADADDDGQAGMTRSSPSRRKTPPAELHADTSDIRPSVFATSQAAAEPHSEAASHKQRKPSSQKNVDAQANTGDDDDDGGDVVERVVAVDAVKRSSRQRQAPAKLQDAVLLDGAQTHHGTLLKAKEPKAGKTRKEDADADAADTAVIMQEKRSTAAKTRRGATNDSEDGDELVQQGHGEKEDNANHEVAADTKRSSRQRMLPKRLQDSVVEAGATQRQQQQQPVDDQHHEPSPEPSTKQRTAKQQQIQPDGPDDSEVEEDEGALKRTARKRAIPAKLQDAVLESTPSLAKAHSKDSTAVKKLPSTPATTTRKAAKKVSNAASKDSGRDRPDKGSGCPEGTDAVQNDDHQDEDMGRSRRKRALPAWLMETDAADEVHEQAVQGKPGKVADSETPGGNTKAAGAKPAHARRLSEASDPARARQVKKESSKGVAHDNLQHIAGDSDVDGMKALPQRRRALPARLQDTTAAGDGVDTATDTPAKNHQQQKPSQAAAANPAGKAQDGASLAAAADNKSSVADKKPPKTPHATSKKPGGSKQADKAEISTPASSHVGQSAAKKGEQPTPAHIKRGDKAAIKQEHEDEGGHIASDDADAQHVDHHVDDTRDGVEGEQGTAVPAVRASRRVAKFSARELLGMRAYKHATPKSKDTASAAAAEVMNPSTAQHDDEDKPTEDNLPGSQVVGELGAYHDDANAQRSNNNNKRRRLSGATGKDQAQDGHTHNEKASVSHGAKHTQHITTSQQNGHAAEEALPTGGTGTATPSGVAATDATEVSGAHAAGTHVSVVRPSTDLQDSAASPRGKARPGKGGRLGSARKSGPRRNDHEVQVVGEKQGPGIAANGGGIGLVNIKQEQLENRGTGISGGPHTKGTGSGQALADDKSTPPKHNEQHVKPGSVFDEMDEATRAMIEALQAEDLRAARSLRARSSRASHDIGSPHTSVKSPRAAGTAHGRHTGQQNKVSKSKAIGPAQGAAAAQHAEPQEHHKPGKTRKASQPPTRAVSLDAPEPHEEGVAGGGKEVQRLSDTQQPGTPGPDDMEPAADAVDPPHQDGDADGPVEEEVRKGTITKEVDHNVDHDDGDDEQVAGMCEGVPNRPAVSAAGVPQQIQEQADPGPEHKPEDFSLHEQQPDIAGETECPQPVPEVSSSKHDVVIEDVAEQQQPKDIATAAAPTETEHANQQLGAAAHEAGDVANKTDPGEDQQGDSNCRAPHEQQEQALPQPSQTQPVIAGADQCDGDVHNNNPEVPVVDLTDQATAAPDTQTPSVQQQPLAAAVASDQQQQQRVSTDDAQKPSAAAAQHKRDEVGTGSAASSQAVNTTQGGKAVKQSSTNSKQSGGKAHSSGHSGRKQSKPDVSLSGKPMKQLTLTAMAQSRAHVKALPSRLSNAQHATSGSASGAVTKEAPAVATEAPDQNATVVEGGGLMHETSDHAGHHAQGTAISTFTGAAADSARTPENAETVQTLAVHANEQQGTEQMEQDKPAQDDDVVTLQAANTGREGVKPAGDVSAQATPTEGAVTAAGVATEPGEQQQQQDPVCELIEQQAASEHHHNKTHSDSKYENDAAPEAAQSAVLLLPDGQTVNADGKQHCKVDQDKVDIDKVVDPVEVSAAVVDVNQAPDQTEDAAMVEAELPDTELIHKDATQSISMEVVETAGVHTTHHQGPSINTLQDTPAHEAALSRQEALPVAMGAAAQSDDVVMAPAEQAKPSNQGCEAGGGGNAIAAHERGQCDDGSETTDTMNAGRDPEKGTSFEPWEQEPLGMAVMVVDPPAASITRCSAPGDVDMSLVPSSSASQQRAQCQHHHEDPLSVPPLHNPFCPTTVHSMLLCTFSNAAFLSPPVISFQQVGCMHAAANLVELSLTQGLNVERTVGCLQQQLLCPRSYAVPQISTDDVPCSHVPARHVAVPPSTVYDKDGSQQPQQPSLFSFGRASTASKDALPPTPQLTTLPAPTQHIQQAPDLNGPSAGAYKQASGTGGGFSTGFPFLAPSITRAEPITSPGSGEGLMTHSRRAAANNEAAATRKRRIIIDESDEEDDEAFLKSLMQENNPSDDDEYVPDGRAGNGSGGGNDHRSRDHGGDHDDEEADGYGLRIYTRSKRARQLSPSPPPELVSPVLVQYISEFTFGRKTMYKGLTPDVATATFQVIDGVSRDQYMMQMFSAQVDRVMALPVWYVWEATGRVSASAEAQLTAAADIQQQQLADQVAPAAHGGTSPTHGPRSHRRSGNRHALPFQLVDLPEFGQAGGAATGQLPAGGVLPGQITVPKDAPCQELLDLQHVYNKLLSHYEPLLAALKNAALPADADLAAGEKVVAAAGLRLQSMAGHLQVLRDCRYFVKGYGGPWAVPPPQDHIRIMCSVRIPAAYLPGHTLPVGGVSRAVHGRTFGLTPPEIILLPARSTVAELKRLCAEALADTYRMFKLKGAAGNAFTVTAILQGLPDHLAALQPEALDQVRVQQAGDSKPAAQSTDSPGNAGADGKLPLAKRPSRLHPPGTKQQDETTATADATDVATPAAASAEETRVTSRAKGRVWHVVDGAHIVVSVSSFDEDERWLHTGGPEDWQVYCHVCGTEDDDGEHMIACDQCGIWVHTRCHQVPDASDPPPTFICSRCSDNNTALRSAGYVSDMDDAE